MHSRWSVWLPVVAGAVFIVLLAWLVASAYALHRAAYAGDVERMRRLLDRGANPDAIVFRFEKFYPPTPVGYAIQGRQPDAVRLLAAAGADLDARIGLRAPLAYCVHDLELAKALLESGADPNVWVDDYYPALAYAGMVRGCEVALLLIEYGADFMARDRGDFLIFEGLVGSCFEHMRVLLPAMLKRGLDVDTPIP